MAEQIIYGVTQTIIENWGSQIFQEIGKLYGVQKEIEKLRGTVSRIGAVLRDAEEQQRHNHQVEHWIELLRGAVGEANELLNRYRYVTDPSRQRAETRITQKIRKKLDAIVKDSEEFKLEVIPREREEDVGDQHVPVPGIGLSACTTVAAAEDLDEVKID